MSGRKKQKIESKDNDSLLDELLKDLDNISAEELQLEGDPTISINKKKPDGDRTKVAKAILFSEAEPEYTRYTDQEKNEFKKSRESSSIEDYYEAPTSSTEARAREEETDFKVESKSTHDQKTRVVSASRSEGLAKIVDRKKDRTENLDSESEKQEEIIFGSSPQSGPMEIKFSHAETLRVAQEKINELEKESEILRQENEMLSSAGLLAQKKVDELMQQVAKFERLNSDLKSTNEHELNIFRENLVSRDQENSALKSQIEELEHRLKFEFRKIRVRERELENRLELSRNEKTAILKSKDEMILNLKRRLDSSETIILELKEKNSEMIKKIESNQEQFSRTVRALRLALTQLEVSPIDLDQLTATGTVAPLKKAD
jgi:hypothetical protein